MKLIKNQTWNRRKFPNSWMLMTLISFFLSTSPMSANHSSAFQYEQIASKKYENVTVREMIRTIENELECVFFFNSEAFDLDRRISINTKELGLNEILTEMLKGTNNTFTIEDRQVYIKQKTASEVSSQLPSSSKIEIKGIVKDETGEPLIGVSVAELKGQNATMTSITGEFRLLVNPNATIKFSYLGFTSTEHKVGSESAKLEIILKEELSALDEVVVVGYRKQAKASLTGSVSTIDMSKKEAETITNAGQALYASAGLWVNQGGGQPGRDNVKIRIRGVNTLSDASPLVLMDGIEYNINEIDPNDIETISVLKDASASIYGSKATNGVILITTKSGKKGKAVVEYRGHFGIQQATYLPDVVTDPIMYMKMRNIAEVNSGSKDPSAVSYSRDIIREYEQGMLVDPSIYPSSDWYDIALQNGFIQQHNARVSGGNESTTYSLGVGYMDQDGVLYMNDNAKRYSMDLKITAKITSKLSVNASVTGNRRKFIEPGYSTKTVFTTISRGLPIFSDYHKNGYYGSSWVHTPGRNNVENPRMQVEQGRVTRDYQELLSRVGFEYKLPFDINYDMVIGYRKIDHYSKNFVPEMYTIHPKTGDVKIFNTNAPRVKDWDAYQYQYTMSHRLQWDRTFNKKHVTHVMIGQDYQINRDRNFQAYNFGFFTNDLSELNALKSQTNAEATGTSSRDRLNSVYSRLAYTYDNRYMLEGTFRYDGSSRFKQENQWTFYPSVLAGWRIDQEDFFDADFINGLKLRASVGKMGNQAVKMYAYKNTVNISDDYNYSFGGVLAGGAAVSQLIDENVRWETTTAYNVGVDVVAFNNKLVFEADVFYKRTKDILRTIAIPSHIGGLSGPSTNVGVVDNKGYELTASYQDKFLDITYGVTGNISYVKNEIKDLGGEVRISGNKILKEGHAIDSYYLYQADGYYQSKEEIRNTQAVYGSKAKLKPGYIKYVNQNGDYVINQDDKVVSGSSIPKYTYSFSGNLGYKGFVLDAQFQGVAGVSVYPTGNIVFPFNNGAGVTKDWATDSWTPNNRDARNPLLTTTTDAPENFIPSTHWLRSGSYLRMKNIQLSYTLPKLITDKLHTDKIMVYVSGQNLVTWSSLKIWDPEISGDISGLSEYPTLKTISCGINVRF